MHWSNALTPVPMRRVAVVAPADEVPEILLAVAETGLVQLDDPATDTPASDDIAARLERLAFAALRRNDVAAVAGWCPSSDLAALTGRLASLDASVVVLPSPPGIDPPTMLGDATRLGRAFAPLVGTYGVVPYRDLDPAIPAGIAYVAMFGMMFGDAGHGLLLIAAAALLRSGRPHRLAGLRRMWPFLAGGGVAATVFGVLYGEFFGPTGVLPVVWLAPLTDPMRLLGAAVTVGAALLGVAYGLGTVNRWREGGLRAALYASSGIAGATVFLGIAAVVAGALIGVLPLLSAGAAAAVAGLSLAVIGLFAESGGGATGAAQTGVGAFDLVVRLGSNVVSFARLAAFGLTHAALGAVIWQATTASAGAGGLGIVAAVVVFTLGNVVAFALEALIAGVQALRLAYYELFSRLFVAEGRPFHPLLLSPPPSQRVPIHSLERAS